jgi:hypothetical protein
VLHVARCVRHVEIGGRLLSASWKVSESHGVAGNLSLSINDVEVTHLKSAL